MLIKWILVNGWLKLLGFNIDFQKVILCLIEELKYLVTEDFSENFSLSIGGENVVHFDNTIDLGRNFYLVASKYYVFPSERNNDPKIL